MNWTTWERELLAVLEALTHFEPVVRGHRVIIRIDHLNNTPMNSALKQPEKILRMLLKVEDLCQPEWQLQPGAGQLAMGSPVIRLTEMKQEA